MIRHLTRLATVLGVLLLLGALLSPSATAERHRRQTSGYQGTHAYVDNWSNLKYHVNTWAALASGGADGPFIAELTDDLFVFSGSDPIRWPVGANGETLVIRGNGHSLDFLGGQRVITTGGPTILNRLSFLPRYGFDPATQREPVNGSLIPPDQTPQARLTVRGCNPADLYLDLPTFVSVLRLEC